MKGERNMSEVESGRFYVNLELVDMLTSLFNVDYVRARDIARGQDLDEFSDKLEKVEGVVGKENAERLVRDGMFAHYQHDSFEEYMRRARIMANKLEYDFNAMNVELFRTLDSLAAALETSAVAKSGEQVAILSFSHDGNSLSDRKARKDELIQAYARWAKKNGYSLEQQGDRLTISGADAYTILKDEEGIHTIIYAGEGKSKGKQYRVEVTILVREPKEQEAIDLEERDIEVYFTGSRGPGGQNVNKTSNNVTLVDKETGISQVARGRSRQSNLGRARAGLEQKLEESSSDIRRIEMPTEQVRRYDIFTLHQVTDQKTRERMSSEKFYKGDFMELLKRRQGG